MKKIEIYSTPTCTYCNLAKQFFRQNGFEYVEYDVAEDLVKREEMVQKTGQMGVPVITIETDGGEENIVGFDEDRIRELLKV